MRLGPRAAISDLQDSRLLPRSWKVGHIVIFRAVTLARFVITSSWSGHAQEKEMTAHTRFELISLYIASPVGNVFVESSIMVTQRKGRLGDSSRDPASARRRRDPFRSPQGAVTQMAQGNRGGESPLSWCLNFSAPPAAGGKWKGSRRTRTLLEVLCSSAALHQCLLCPGVPNLHQWHTSRVYFSSSTHRLFTHDF